MRKIAAVLALGIILGAVQPCTPAWGVTRETFLTKTTQDLVDLCSAPESDPLYQAAIGFCLGFAVGALQTHLAENAGPDGKKLVCLPDPPPTREQGVQMFVTWAKQNQQFMKEAPVEGLYRFLIGRWPCPVK